uniref:Uncharacterized protein n=1 Tax=Marmota marmota marmota TaxID=9994 RepID=A0A8C5ZFK5_MARMA
MRRRWRQEGFYPAPDFPDREAEDMAGVFDTTSGPGETNASYPVPFAPGILRCAV